MRYCLKKIICGLVTASVLVAIDNSTDLRLYSGEGRIVESNIETGALIKLDVNASVGQSGSPVYAVTKNIPESVKFRSSIDRKRA